MSNLPKPKPLSPYLEALADLDGLGIHNLEQDLAGPLECLNRLDPDAATRLRNAAAELTEAARYAYGVLEGNADD